LQPLNARYPGPLDGRGSEPQDDVVELIPALRAFARTFCRDLSDADDLVQETLTKGLANLDKFEPGTRMKSWLFTIMRNSFNNEYRRSKRMVQDIDDRLAETLAVPAGQVGWGIAQDLRAGLGMLSPDQQQALYLVGAAGLSYDEAAERTGCHAGTIKSRVSRARSSLAAFMAGDDRSMSRRSLADHARARRAA